MENDPAVWGVSDMLVPISRYTLRQYLEHASADFQEVRQLRLVLCRQDTQAAVGTVDVFDYSPLHQRASVGITVLGQHRRQGYGRAALDLLVLYAHQVLQLHQMYCTIAVTNRASIRLFKAAGFKKIGVRREWLRTPSGWQDVVEMQHLLVN
ncbi:GNAT family N-acetyltransferase [Hymenobacter sp. 5414T-23]|uniref:GNAT family N-acetyltransferase n=1 Tax=Hymenobacter sp. 5414T-23 TaxID=2932252 RepID=UPI001FD129C3|nr:GNAT family protein [Hymenobacter sp. 5414T-23]UOQ83172.1 GNAT family N-acetyltransferase [Hymenobacter sp. 5414T-23]